MRIWFPVLAITLFAVPAAARPVLLELFTSQSCSSCPPAEALLAALKATQPGVTALEFHVDYWNALNWRDPYSSRAATARQRAYAERLGSDVFTPQLIVDGRRSEIGSDSEAIRAAIADARGMQETGPALSVTRTGSGLTIEVGQGAVRQAAIGDGAGPAVLLLAGYDAAHRTAIPSGENAGATLDEVNLVRDVRQIGEWQGKAIAVTVPQPAGEFYAVILQRADGTVLAATFPSSR